MITTNIDQVFTLTSVLIDETTGEVATGETVYYDVRKQPGDTILSPVITGVLTESSVESGVYNKSLTISEAGNFTAYITCSGFYPATEDIIVAGEDLFELVKQNRQHNLYVEDVIRTSVAPTADQVIRKVPLNKTDYVITKIKDDQDSDWSSSTIHRVYAWYENEDDTSPYKMGEQS